MALLLGMTFGLVVLVSVGKATGILSKESAIWAFAALSIVAGGVAASCGR